MGPTEERRKEIANLLGAIDERGGPHVTLQIERAARQFYKITKDLWLALAEAERVADENYADLLDQMDEAWGSTPECLGQEVGRLEINAFLESRFVHKPTTRLRVRLAEAERLAAHEEAARTRLLEAESRVSELEKENAYLRTVLENLADEASDYGTKVRAIGEPNSELEAQYLLWAVDAAYSLVRGKVVGRYLSPPQVRQVREAAEPLAWDKRWGTWLAQMPVEVARAIVGIRKRLQDALPLLGGEER